MPRVAASARPRPDALVGSGLIVAAGAVFVLALALRLPGLGAWVTTDSFRWYERTRVFWDALAAHRWDGTFRYHPGVLFMWLAGASLKLGDGLDAGMTPATIRAATLPIAVVGALLAGGSVYLLARLFPAQRMVAVLAGGLIATEPFLVGHSQSMHLDMLVTTFAWLAVLATGIALDSRSRAWAATAGALLGLALLAKSFAATIVVGVALWILVRALRARDGQPAVLGLVLAGTALVVVVLLWPALAAYPVWTVSGLLSAGSVEVFRGHQIFFLGTVSEHDPGAGYYLIVALFRTSPEVLLGAFGGLVAVLATPRLRHRVGGLIVTYLLAALFVCLAPKKSERYFVPFLPLICTLAAVGAVVAVGRVRSFARDGRSRAAGICVAVLIAVLGARTWRVARVHPYAVAWCAPIPGLAAEQAFTLGWGEGMAEVAAWIRDASPGRMPLLFAGTYRDCMSPWLRSFWVEPAKAEFIVRYLSDDQRQRYREETDPFVLHQTPLHEVWIDGRRYAAIYAGPRHPAYSHGR